MTRMILPDGERGVRVMTIEEANYPIDLGIKHLCDRKGIKRKYLAEQIGCSEQALCDIFARRRLIKACEIPRFAQALGVTIDEIYAAGAADQEEKG